MHIGLNEEPRVAAGGAGEMPRKGTNGVSTNGVTANILFVLCVKLPNGKGSTSSQEGVVQAEQLKTSQLCSR